MKKAAPLLIVALLAALAYLALRESGAARAARTARDAAVQERDALRTRVTALEKRAESLAAENSALQARTDSSSASPPPPPGARVFTRAVPGGRMPGPMAMFDSPEARQLMAVEQKGRLDARYAGLFQALRLSPDKLDRLKQLLVDKQSTAMDVIAAAHQQNLLGSGIGTDVRNLVQQETGTIDQSIHELLGDTAFDEYLDYERTRVERSLVDRLASRLSYSESPLSAAQAESLVDLLSAQRSTQPPAEPSGQPGMRMAVSVGGGDTMVAFAGSGALDSIPINDSTINNAQSVLNGAQLAALLQLQAEQQAQVRMGELIRQNLPPPPPPEGGATWVAAPVSPAPGP